MSRLATTRPADAGDDLVRLLLSLQPCTAPSPEVERRIALYARRAAEGRCVFTGRKRVARRDSARCAGCGRRPAKANHLSKGGWMVRELGKLPGGQDRSVDVLCLRCRWAGLSLEVDAA